MLTVLTEKQTLMYLIPQINYTSASIPILFRVIALTPPNIPGLRSKETKATPEQQAQQVLPEPPEQQALMAEELNQLLLLIKQDLRRQRHRLVHGLHWFRQLPPINHICGQEPSLLTQTVRQLRHTVSAVH